MRVPNGLKGNRLSLILAVLSKHARMPLYKVSFYCLDLVWHIS